MATDRSPSGDLRGILIPDPRFSGDNLQPKGAGATDSSYTEAGPRPGVPDPQQGTSMVLQASGSQSADGHIVVRTLRAGHPGSDRGGFGWRRSADSDYMGWDGPQVITGWETLYYSTAAVGYEIHPDVVLLQSGKMLAAWNTSTLGVVKVSRYDPATGAWTAVDLGPDGAGSGYATRGCSFCQLPNGRVLAAVFAFDATQVDVYYSDDDGTTWAAYSKRCLRTALSGSTAKKIRIRASGTDVLLLAWFDSGGTDYIWQYSSDDLGASFSYVGADPATGPPSHMDAVALPGGGFVVGYFDTLPKSVVIPTASQAIETTTPVDLTSSGSAYGLSLFSDDDGTIYAYVRASDTATATVNVARSIDGGQSWEAMGYLHRGTGTDYLERFAVGIVAGRIALVTRWVSSTATTLDGQSIAVVWLGGFSSHTAPFADGTTNYTDASLGSYGRTRGRSWLPVELPGDNGWTAAGAGTDALSSGLLAVDTVANTRYFDQTDNLDGDELLFMEVALRVDAGSGSKTTDRIAAKLRWTDAGSEYEVSLRFDDTGWKLWDEVAGSAVGATVTVDMTSLRRVRLALEGPRVKTWYATQGHTRTWTAGPSSSTLTSAGATGNPRRLRWGHLSITTGGSDWESVLLMMDAGRFTPTDTGTPLAAWSNPASLHPRSFPAFPSLVTDGIRLRAVDGPSRLGELWDVETRYDYPWSVVLPVVDPSPRVQWRTLADEVDVYLTFDLGDASGGRLLGTSIGLFILGANIESALLEQYDGAWQTVGTAYATQGWSSLPYRRDGDVVYPDTGVASSSAWLSYGLHKGGVFRLDATTYRKIADHSEGAWEDGATKRPWIRLEGITGAEPASGTGKILARDFGVVIHEQSIDARYWRIKIPSQVTVSGDYRIGQIVVGHVALFGWQWSLNWGRSTKARVRQQQWGDGQSRVRVEGPVSRVVEVSWSDGVDGTQLRGSAVAPDYIAGSSGGLPIAARVDGPRLMEGILDAMDGPASPVLLLPRVVRGTGDQRLAGSEMIVWGRLSEEFSRDNVVGNEGLSEVERSGRVALTELT